MEIGEHCSFASCKRLDFLPVKCQYCKLNFCSECASVNVHSCPDVPTLEEVPSQYVTKIEKQRCQIDQCAIGGVKIKCDFWNVSNGV